MKCGEYVCTHSTLQGALRGVENLYVHTVICRDQYNV